MSWNIGGVPKLHKTLIIGDDAILCAQVCAALCQKGRYLTLLDGPRMNRPDSDHEIVRRTNVAAKLLPENIVLVGISESTCAELKKNFGQVPVYQIENYSEFQSLPLYSPRRRVKRISGITEQIGQELYHALVNGSELEIAGDLEDEDDPLQSNSHLVVCENSDPIAQITAANYAYCICADFKLVPSIAERKAKEILRGLYSIYDRDDLSVTERLEWLRSSMREHLDSVEIEKYKFLTFVTEKVPYGFSYTKIPSTHIFSYPDIGISIFNGVHEEQKDTKGIRVAAFFDSGEVEAREISQIVDELKNRIVFIKGASSAGASVDYVSNLVELYPYDLLVVSSHCGDDTGWQFTYEYIDSEGYSRNLVVDVAISISGVAIDEKFEVSHYVRFVSLDGVDWDNEEEKSKLYVGRAIHDYLERDKSDPDFQPVKKEPLGRVYDSSALKMYDGSYLVMLSSIACNKSPIIFNNACCSWHNLAGRFTFAGARAYIGTLIDVSDAEAQEVAIQLFRSQYGKPLGIALWQAQNRVYGSGNRHPYVMVGPHFQRIRTTRDHTPAYIVEELRSSAEHLNNRLQQKGVQEQSHYLSLKRRLRFVEGELKGMIDRYFTT